MFRVASCEIKKLRVAGFELLVVKLGSESITTIPER